MRFDGACSGRSLISSGFEIPSAQFFRVRIA